MWNKRSDTIVHEKSPFNAEPSRSALAASMIAGLETFYSRNHGLNHRDVVAVAGQLLAQGF